MSNAVFPTLPGLAWEFKRVPMHKTQIKETVSGREYRGQLMNSPRYTYKATYEFLRDQRQGYDELRPLLGFFNARSGSFDDWLFNDADDNAATAMQFGLGDGATTQFQLTRTLGGTAEPVYEPNGAVSIFKSAVLQAQPGACSVSATGLVTFVAAPAAAAPLTWTGAFYWRCRFVQDQLEFAKFAYRLWNLKTCDFITVKP